MAPVIIQPRETTQPDAANASSALKRMNDDEVQGPCTVAPPTKLVKMEEKKLSSSSSVILNTYNTSSAASAANNKARETRLEQNRKAARESRRRKKVMIEDLQRSVIFFSRANGALKHQNDDLTRLLMQAQAQVSVIESTNNTNNNTTTSTTNAAPAPTTTTTTTPSTSQQPEQAAAESESEVPSQPLATATAPVYPLVPAMQPGATMQAMASFQQAAAAAMQVAVQGMQSISPGASLASLAQPAPTSGSANAQQAYNDTMTALAMQQAAIAAAAVPPHLMAQIVGSTPTWPAQAVILPTTAPAAPVPVAPMPWPPVALAAPVAPAPTTATTMTQGGS